MKNKFLPILIASLAAASIAVTAVAETINTFTPTSSNYVNYLSAPAKRLKASISPSTMSFQLSDIKGWNGQNLTSSSFGGDAYVIFHNDAGTAYEVMQIDPSTIANQSITILKRGMQFNGNLTNASTSLALTWIKTTTIVELGTDVPQLLAHAVQIGGDQSISGRKTFDGNYPIAYSTTPTINSSLQIPSKSYVDQVASSGASNASQSAKGLVQIATPAQIASGTATSTDGTQTLWNIVSAGQYGKTYGATPTVSIVQYNSQLASSTYTFTDTDAGQHSWTVPNLGTNEYIVVTASAGQGANGGATTCPGAAGYGAGGGGGGGSTALSNNISYAGTFNLFASGGGGGSGAAGGNCAGSASGGGGGLGGKISNASTTVTAGTVVYYTIGLQPSAGGNTSGGGVGVGSSGGQGHLNGTTGGTGSGYTSGNGGTGATDTVAGGAGGPSQGYSGNFTQGGIGGSNGNAISSGSFSAGSTSTASGNGSITVVLYYTQGVENVSSTVSGNNFGGTVTVSAATAHLSPTTSTINFAPWNFPVTGVSCTANTWASSLAPFILTETTTSVQFGFSSTIAGGKYNYLCNAY